jgi:serine/threonine protein phosphatase PrpC
MAFFRRFLRAATMSGSTGEPAPVGDPDRSQTSERSDSSADQSELVEDSAASEAWWHEASADEVPATEQASEPVPLKSDSNSDESETPTAPYSALTEEVAREYLREADQSGDDDPTVEPLEAADALELTTDQLDGTLQLARGGAPPLTAQRSVQGLAAMAQRDVGRRREVNQDNFVSLLTTVPREGADLSAGLFVVADGMGGHDGGEVASQIAVSTVVRHVMSRFLLPALQDEMTEALQTLMIAAVQEANQAIYTQAQMSGSDMGTTCTAVLLVGSGLYIAHVGDTRAYLAEPGGLRQLTTDHSTVGRLIQVGQLDPEEAREHPLRNQLYRTVGQQPHVQVDFIYQPIGTASHLLVCSDGLWGMVEDSLIEQAVQRSIWPQDACQELIALANLAGGDDNISAIVVSLPVVER